MRQKNKVGPIDAIDHIAAMMACWMRNGSIEPEDSLVAKCWDLSHAYKQVPLSDDAFNLDSYLAVYDPSSESARPIASGTAFKNQHTPMTSKLLTRVEGEKLRRRLQFASSQVFGRKLRRLLKVLSNHVTQGRKVLSDLTLKCFSDISELLPESTRRRISASQSEILRIYM